MAAQYGIDAQTVANRFRDAGPHPIPPRMAAQPQRLKSAIKHCRAPGKGRYRRQCVHECRFWGAMCGGRGSKLVLLSSGMGNWSTTVRIGLLGPTRVAGVDGSIGGARLRSVLARLAVDVGSPVSVDRLLEDIWGDAVPVKGANALAFQISKLRDLLDPDRSGTGRLVVTGPAGYTLALDRAEVDVHRFEQLVDDAVGSLDDPVRARQLSEQALSLWGGRPFADIPDALFFDEHAHRLEQMHLVAERTLFRARCLQGEDVAVIPGLESLVRRHPLEEGLVADLMGALARSGRAAEALRAFGDLRIRLGDELGIEPSADLLRLEQEVLSGSMPSFASEPRLAVGVVEAQVESMVRHNLPERRGVFVGRVGEIDMISDALAGGRLMTLTGTGGAGKTRLSVEYAHRVAGEFADGVWVVELAAVSDASLVMGSVADVFGLRASEEEVSIEDVVTRYLCRRSLLLVVDNCEQVLSGAVEVIAVIQRAAPGVRVIATSRESLGLPAEVVVSVPALTLPTGDPGSARAESVELFLERAVRADPDLEIDAATLEAADAICRRLDGMPLAIELAAARLRLLSVADLVDRLAESFGVLAGSDKEVPERQRTLEATVDWSYRLLDIPEQTLFRSLSVLPGTFDVGAAEAVGVDDHAEQWRILPLLDALVDKSLVQVSRADGGPRFFLLEPVRQFAERRLAEAGASDRVRLRHAEHVIALVSDASPRLRGHEQIRWYRMLDAEQHHLRRALATLLGAGQIDRYLDLAFDLFCYWRIGGSNREAIDAIERGLLVAPTDTDPGRLVRAWYELAEFALGHTSSSILDPAQRGLDVAIASGDPNAIGRMKLIVGFAIGGGWTSTDPAIPVLREDGRRLLEANPAPTWWEPGWERGFHHALLGAFVPLSDRARDDFTIAIEEFERAGDRVMLAEVLSDTAPMWDHTDNAWVLDCVRRSIEIHETFEVATHGHASARQQLGRLLIRIEEHADAAEQFRRAVSMLEGSPSLNSWAVSTRLRALSDVRAGGQPAAAARWLLDVIESRAELTMPEMHTPELLDIAAFVLARGGDPKRAAVVFGKAEAVPPPIDTGVDRTPIHADIRATVLAEIDHKQFDQHRQQGKNLAVESAFAFAVDALTSLAASDR